MNIETRVRDFKKEADQCSFEPEKHRFFPQTTVFVLGGGPSLKDFDPSLLRDKFVIGCNDAYTLGADLVNVVAFADWRWWDLHRVSLCNSYEGPVLSTNGRARHDPRLRWIRRFPHGLFNKNGVGWNYSTGALCINIALRFGARRVVLLGIDLCRDARRSQNWHPNILASPHERTYLRYMDGFRRIQLEQPKVFPGVEIINANLDSKLELFPKIAREEAFKCY